MKKLIKTFVSIFVLTILAVSSSATAAADEAFRDVNSYFHLCDEFCVDKEAEQLVDVLLRTRGMLDVNYEYNSQYRTVMIEHIRALANGDVVGSIEVMPMQEMCCSRPSIRVTQVYTHEFCATTRICLFVRRNTLRECTSCRSVHSFNVDLLSGCGRLHF